MSDERSARRWRLTLDKAYHGARPQAKGSPQG